MADKSARRPIREKLYVQVIEVDKTPTFIDVSTSIGKTVKFTKPVATAALRVTSDAVFISCLKLSARTRTSFTSKPLSLPPGPLARLERQLDAAEPVAPGTLFARLDDGQYLFTLRHDDAGIATVELAGDAEETVIELPKNNIVLTMMLPGPKGRTIVVGWTGYINKPGTRETISRIVAQALNHITGLAAFQTLSGINTVKVPAAPGRLTLAAPVRSKADIVSVTTPVQLWPHGGGAALGAGNVTISLDLDDANPTTNRLLFHIVPDPDIAEVFEPYRPVLENIAHAEVANQYGADEVDDLVCDIVLGELAVGQIERLKESVLRISHGVQLSPQQGLLNADQSGTA